MRPVFLFVLISTTLLAQDVPPLTAKQIMETDFPLLRGQAVLEGYPDFPSVSTRPRTEWERATLLHEAVVAPAPAVDPIPSTGTQEAGVVAVTALKHKVPKEARKGNERGVAFAKKGEHVKATAEFKRAIAVDPQFADAHNNFGSEAFLLGHLEEAAREFRQAVEFNPALAAAYVNLATAELLMGNHAEALDHVRRAITLGDRTFHARSILASALLKSNPCTPRVQ